MFNHGFAENCELYEEFLPHYALSGFEVVNYDQRGSGKTSPGKLYGITNEKLIFEDLDKLLAVVFEEYPNEPVYLWGNSMGAAIVLNYAVHGTYRNKLAGYIALAPLVLVHPSTLPNFFLKKIMPIAAALVPNLRNKPTINVTHITHDERWQKRLKSDSNERVICTAAQMHCAFERGKKLMDPNYVKNIAPKPIVVFHSTEDQVNDFNASVRFFEILPETVPLKKFFRYTDFAHCLPQETLDRQYKVLRDVLSFLAQAEAINGKTTPETGTSQPAPAPVETEPLAETAVEAAA